MDLKLGRIFARADALTHYIDDDIDDASVSSLYIDICRPFAYILILKLDLEFEQALQQIKAQLPDSNSHATILKQWWEANGQAWIEKLREVMIQHRNIGHDWQFNQQQKDLLQQYYDANKLLVDCLNSTCNVTPAVRNEIEETLLLPTKMLPNAEA